MASNVIEGLNPQKTLDFSGMSGGLFRSRTTEAKRARQDSSEDMNYVCGKCDKQIDEGIKCAGCKQLFCFNCAGVSKGLYSCLIKGELDDFRWDCKCCKSLFPSLDNISKVLHDIKTQHDSRLSTVESRLDQFEEKTKESLQEYVTNLKSDIIDSIKEDINGLVDSRNSELEDRRRRELNITVFGLPEHNNLLGSDNKREDEADMKFIGNKLGIQDLNIVICFRLGKKLPNKTRALKVILAEKSHRKFMLDNAKFIPTKLPQHLKNLIISKDLTPVQREERKVFIMNKRGTRKVTNAPGQNVEPPQASTSAANGINQLRKFNFRAPRNFAAPQPEVEGTPPNFQSTMLDNRPQITSQDAMETESLHISPIQGNLTNLNVFENSMSNITRVQSDSVYDQTTLQDGEQTVIGGTQASYQEEPVSPTMNR